MIIYWPAASCSYGPRIFVEDISDSPAVALLERWSRWRGYDKTIYYDGKLMLGFEGPGNGFKPAVGPNSPESIIAELEDMGLELVDYDNKKAS